MRFGGSLQISAWAAVATWGSLSAQQDVGAWAAAAREIVAESRLSDRACVQALRLLEVSTTTTDPEVHAIRHDLVKRLMGRAGRMVRPQDGEPVQVPDRLALRRIASEAARGTGDDVLYARAQLGEAFELARVDQNESAHELATSIAERSEAGSQRSVAYCLLADMALRDLEFDRAKALLERARDLAPAEDDSASREIRAYVDGTWGKYYEHVGRTDVGVRASVDEEGVVGRTSAVAKREIDQLIASDRFSAAVTRAQRWEEAASAAGRADEVEHARLLGAIAGVHVDRLRSSAVGTLRELSKGVYRKAAAVTLAAAATEDRDWDAVRTWLDAAGAVRGSLAVRALFARGLMALAQPEIPSAELEREFEAIADRYITEWNRTEPDLGGVGFLEFRQRRDLLSLLVSIRLRRHEDGVERAFADMLRFRDCGAFARRHELGPSTLAQAQALVPEGGLAVAWVMGHVGSHAFLLDGQTVEHYGAPSETETLDLARRFKQLVLRLNVGATEIAPLGDAVRSRVFPSGAWQRVSAVERLLIIGGHEWGLPFEALPSEGEAYLGWSHAMVHLPSVAVGTWLAAREVPERIESSELRTAMDPHAATAASLGVEPLRVESGALERVWGPLAGTEVAIGRLGDGAGSIATDYRVVVCHGTFDDERKRGAGLVAVEEPGVLFSEDLERWSGAPWTVLAACGAARGVLRGGEDGGNHLGAACFVSGASTVLVANADLELSSTLALLESFHRHLAIGEPIAPAEALRRARRSVGAASGFASPMCHSLLMVTGRGFDPVIVASAPRGFRTYGWWMGGAIGAALLIWLVRRFAGR